MAPSTLKVVSDRNASESLHHPRRQGTDTCFFTNRTLWIRAPTEIYRQRLERTCEFCPRHPRRARHTLMGSEGQMRSSTSLRSVFTFTGPGMGQRQHDCQ